MPNAHIRGFDVQYAGLGPPDGIPLVLLHGATETFDVGWRRLAPRLAGQWPPASARAAGPARPAADGLRIIGPDMRGHGRSGNPDDRLDLREIADDVAALLDVLDVASAHVCGFSGGASATLFCGMRHPARVRSLTLISNNARRDEARQASNFWDPARLARDDPHWLAAMRRWHQVPPERLLGWWAAEDRLRPDFSAAELSGMLVPTLVVAGDRDPIVPLELSVALYRSLPDARLLVVPGVGHGAPHKAPSILARTIRAFIRDVEAGAVPSTANRSTR